MKRTAIALAVAFCMGVLARPYLSRIYHSPDPMTPVPNPHSSHRHVEFCRLSVGDFPAVLLGDSIFDLWRYHPEHWSRFFSGSLNLGVSGDGVENIIWRVQNGELDNCRANAVVILVGTNNIARRHTPVQIAAAVGKLVSLVRDKQPQARILLVSVLPREPVEHMPTVRALNEQLAQIPGVLFVDAFQSFLKIDSPDPLLLPDGVHPSVAGYDVLGGLITSKIRSTHPD